MKNIKGPFVFGTLMVASLAAIHCGGDSSNSTPGGTAGSSSGTSGSAGSANNGGSAENGGSANNGGSNSAGSANNGGSNSAGSANNGGANNGGSGNPTDAGGAGTQMGAGGTQVGGDGGMCPATAPMNDAACAGNVVCTYPSMMANFERTCACRATGMRTDGGERARVFTCANVFVPPPRDAGAGAGDAGTGRCPNGTSGGDRCTMSGEACRLGNNGACVCFMVANNLEWLCN